MFVSVTAPPTPLRSTTTSPGTNGGVVDWFTVKLAALLVVDPATFVATHRYWFPDIETVVPAIVSVAVVTPEKLPPLLRLVKVAFPASACCH